MKNKFNKNSQKKRTHNNKCLGDFLGYRGKNNDLIINMSQGNVKRGVDYRRLKNKLEDLHVLLLNKLDKVGRKPLPSPNWSSAFSAFSTQTESMTYGQPCHFENNQYQMGRFSA